LIRQRGQALTVAALAVAAISAVILAVLTRRQLSPVAAHVLAAEVSVD
jgi:hypothetical protein